MDTTSQLNKSNTFENLLNLTKYVKINDLKRTILPLDPLQRNIRSAHTSLHS